MHENRSAEGGAGGVERRTIVMDSCFEINLFSFLRAFE